MRPRFTISVPNAVLVLSIYSVDTWYNTIVSVQSDMSCRYCTCMVYLVPSGITSHGCAPIHVAMTYGGGGLKALSFSPFPSLSVQGLPYRLVPYHFQAYYTIPVLNWYTIYYHTNTWYVSSSHTIPHIDTITWWYQYGVRYQNGKLCLYLSFHLFTSPHPPPSSTIAVFVQAQNRSMWYHTIPPSNWYKSQHQHSILWSK